MNIRIAQKVIAMFLLGLSTTIFCNKQEKKATPTWLNLCIGASARAVEVTACQPLARVANDLMRHSQEKIRLQPNVLYKGYLASQMSLVPSTAIQVGAKRMLSEHVPDTAAAVGAGFFSATVNCPSKLLVLQQQIAQDKARPSRLRDVVTTVVNTHGPSRLYRGMAPTIGRDAIFTTGFLALAPRIAKRLGVDPQQDKMKAAFVGGIPAGLLTATMTHPLSTMRVRMQEDLAKKRYPTTLTTAKRIYEKQGPLGFYKGLSVRLTRLALGTSILAYCTQRFTEAVE